MVVKEEIFVVMMVDFGLWMQCSVCWWIYDLVKGELMQDVVSGMLWSEVLDNFLCLECFFGKDVFDELVLEVK